MSLSHTLHFASKRQNNIRDWIWFWTQFSNSSHPNRWNVWFEFRIRNNLHGFLCFISRNAAMRRHRVKRKLMQLLFNADNNNSQSQNRYTPFRWVFIFILLVERRRAFWSDSVSSDSALNLISLTQSRHESIRMEYIQKNVTDSQAFYCILSFVRVLFLFLLSANSSSKRRVSNSFAFHWEIDYAIDIDTHIYSFQIIQFLNFLCRSKL